MGPKALKQAILKKAQTEGEAKVRNKLVQAGLGLSTAAFLAKGQYRSEPKARVMKVLAKVLSK